MTEQLYYILSLKYSNGQHFYMFWGPKRSGYGFLLENAGKYTQAEVLEYGLNDGETTLAVPCEYVDSQAKHAVYYADLRAMREHAMGAKAT